VAAVIGEALLAGGLGLAVGSFISCAADRLPRGEALLGRSRCEGCRRRLTVGELLPVLSYLWLRGRCRQCGRAIGWRSPLVEAGAGLLGLGCWWWLGPNLTALVAGLQLALLLLIAVIDIEQRRVLNWLVVPAWPLVGVSAWFWPGLSPVDSLLGGAIAFSGLLLVALVRPGALGMGDVKLAGLVGLLTGLSHLGPALFVAFVSGGAVAAGLLATGRIGRRDPLPFAPFLCLGAAAATLPIY
jgi:leader peptidase (prepilin peptidase)/N-methyltransferase